MRALGGFGLFIVMVALSALFGAAPAHATAPSSAGCRGFSGRWQTSWPGWTTKLTIVGTRGSYSYKRGRLAGHVSGGVFAGTYVERDGATGTFHFALAADGNSFAGWYAAGGSAGRRLYWKGICIGP